MHVRDNGDTAHDLTADAMRADLGWRLSAGGIGRSGERRQRYEPVCSRSLVLGEADSGNGKRGERSSWCSERSLMERGDDRADIEGREHGHPEAGPPVTHSPQTQRDQPVWLIRSN